jgi:hypothetical protein
VPTGRWFRLRVDFCGRRAAISLDDNPPLVVERLAHPAAAAWLGLWTYLPAHFADLRVSTCAAVDAAPGVLPSPAENAVETWFVEGFGVVRCEPNGVVNLNRYLPASLGEVRLTRRFEMPAEGAVTFEFGFSDALSLELDGHEIYRGEHTFKGFADLTARGWVEPGAQSVQQAVAAGVHRLTAALSVTEGFGWGLALAARGEGLRWLPAELG